MTSGFACPLMKLKPKHQVGRREPGRFVADGQKINGSSTVQTCRCIRKAAMQATMTKPETQTISRFPRHVRLWDIHSFSYVNRVATAFEGEKEEVFEFESRAEMLAAFEHLVARDFISERTQ